MNVQDTLTGRGWSFPTRFTEDAETLSTNYGLKNILKSLQILFTTIPGQRIAHPHFGCDLQQYVFRSINNSLLAQIEATVSTAITLFEPRIKLLDTTVEVSDAEPHMLLIDIEFKVSQTNSRFNLVLPFNIMEGLQLNE